jgi:acylphosphatase
MMEKVALKAYISGLVQGVGYRYFAYREATRMKLSGYVKNLPDGRVEVFAEGPRNQLTQFLMVLEEGPRFSDVQNIEIEWLESHNKYQSFRIDSGY